MHRQAGAAAGTGAGCLQKQAMEHTMTDYGSSVPVLRQSDRGIVALPFRHGLSTCTRQSGRLAKRVSADSTDTAKKRLADQDGSSRAPGILFPTGREQEYRCLGTRVPAAGNRSTNRQRAEKVLTIQPPGKRMRERIRYPIRKDRHPPYVPLLVICPYIWRISCSFPSSIRKVVPFPISELFTKILP